MLNTTALSINKTNDFHNSKKRKNRRLKRKVVERESLPGVTRMAAALVEGVVERALTRAEARARPRGPKRLEQVIRIEAFHSVAV